MSKFHTISVQAMKSIFDCIVSEHPLIFWMRAPDLSKTLYLSKTFEEQFHIPRENMFSRTQRLKDFILTGDPYESNESAEKLRMAQPELVQDAPNEFKLLSGTKHIIYVRDRSFPIHDNAGNIIATAGIAEDFTHAMGNRDAQTMHTKDFAVRFKQLQNEIDAALMQEFKLRTVTDTGVVHKEQNKSIYSGVEYTICGIKVAFPPREAQCLTETLKGHSAKMVAYVLGLSQRTVEEYLNNARNRLNCRTKLELVSKISEVLS